MWYVESTGMENYKRTLLAKVIPSILGVLNPFSVQCRCTLISQNLLEFEMEQMYTDVQAVMNRILFY